MRKQTLALFLLPILIGCSRAEPFTGYPAAGEYSLMEEDPNHPLHQGFPTKLSLSDKKSFDDWIKSRSSDTRKSINAQVEGGSFTIDSSECNTPDRDINGIDGHITGSFTPTTLDIEEHYKLLGTNAWSKKHYKLMKADPVR